MPFEISADQQSYDNRKEITNKSFEGPARSPRHEVANMPLSDSSTQQVW